MARYPDALWRPLTVDKSRWRLVPLRMNLHIAVSEAASLYGYFNGARSRPDSHFYVRRDGTVEQYVDTKLVAYADLEGNGSTISVETQGGVTRTQSEPWTAAQVEALAKLYAWAVETHGLAVQVAADSRPGKTSHGLSWHRLGCDGHFPGRPLHGRVAGGRRYSKAVGKVCPGDAKIRQVPAVFSRARQILGGAATPTPSAPSTGPSARPDAEVQMALAALGYYDAGPALKYLDGKNGDHQKAAVTAYQRDRGLTPDGWWGTNTDKHYRENDMSTLIEQIVQGVLNARIPVQRDGKTVTRELGTLISGIDAAQDRVAGAVSATRADVAGVTEAVTAIGEVSGMDREQVRREIADTVQKAQVTFAIPEED